MNFASVCSGIEAASVAWLPFGWRCVFLSEIDKFPCALLNHYYPSTPNYGDMLKSESWPAHAIDVLIGGTPCQDFSVAGQRAGMGGARGNLTLRFLDVVARYSPRWVVWENVPGILSIDGGRAFGAFLGGLAQRGYGFAYRVLDAQYSGLAQRRERVFVVGCSGGDWQRAAAVLFDAPRLRWDPPPRREAGKRTAPSISARTQGGGGLGTDAECDGALIAGTQDSGSGRRRGAGIQPEAVIPIQEIGKRQSGTPENGVGYGQPGDPMFTWQANDVHGVATAVTSRNSGGHGITERGDGSQCLIAHTLTGEAFDASEDGTGRGTPLVSLARTHHSRQIAHGMAVRRLTPREVERLFGFTYDYTLIPYRGRPACDGPRYRALGNSMAVPVIRWIGQRIALVNNL